MNGQQHRIPAAPARPDDAKRRSRRTGEWVANDPQLGVPRVAGRHQDPLATCPALSARCAPACREPPV